MHRIYIRDLFVDDLVEEFGYKSSLSVKQGMENFAACYKRYSQ